MNDSHSTAQAAGLSEADAIGRQSRGCASKEENPRHAAKALILWSAYGHHAIRHTSRGVRSSEPVWRSEGLATPTLSW
jgi:hypothetical protein